MLALLLRHFTKWADTCHTADERIVYCCSSHGFDAYGRRRISDVAALPSTYVQGGPIKTVHI